jgi:hypothetical protein
VRAAASSKVRDAHAWTIGLGLRETCNGKQRQFRGVDQPRRTRRAWINDERSHRCARRLARPRDVLRTQPCVVGSPLLPARLSPLASALQTFHSSLVTLSGRKPTSHVSLHDPTPTPTSPPLYALYIPRHDVLSVVGVAPLPLVSDPLAPSSITPTPPRCVPALPPHSTRSASHTFSSLSLSRAFSTLPSVRLPLSDALR